MSFKDLRIAATAVAFLVSSGVPLAQDCSDLLSLGRETREVVQSESDLRQYASNFCRDYSQYKSSGDAGSLSGSYGPISIGASSSSSDVESTASKYCSAERSDRASDSAYRNYISTLAPGITNAYESCLAHQRVNMRYDLGNATLIAEELQIPTSYRGTIGDSQALLNVVSTSGVECGWTGSDSSRIALTPLNSTILICTRSRSDRSSAVTIVHENSDVGAFRIDWPAFSVGGIPMNAIRELETEYEQAISDATALTLALRSSVVAFASAECPSGWVPYEPAAGVFIRGIDVVGGRDPDGLREPGSTQEGIFGAHGHATPAPDDKVGNPDAALDTSSGSDQRRRYWRGTTGLVTTQSTGGTETRPTNVALLYCTVAE